MKRIGQFLLMLGILVGLIRQAGALSVGDIAVRSHRGEPFHAEVRYFLEPQEREKGIEVRIGNAADYRAEALTRPAIVDRLGTTLVRDGRDLVRLTSTTPLEESSFDLLLLVRSGHLTIVRNFRVTLPDIVPPPVIVAAESASKSFPVVPPPGGPRFTAAVPPRKPAPAAAAPPSPIKETVKATVETPPRPASGNLPQRYGPVQNGATLYSIVRELRIPSQRLWQGVVLLWRANQGKFTRGNMHGLQAGGYLAIPANLPGQLDSLTTEAAQQIIEQQWQAWRNKQVIPPIQETPEPQQTPPAVPVEAPQVATPALTIAKSREPAVTAEEPAPAVVFPGAGSAPSVNMTELQELLLGLEDRLARRLSPVQEPQGAVSFVSSSELQTTLKNLEDRLTRQVEQVLAQYGLAIPSATGQTLSTPLPASRLTHRLPEAATSSSGSWLSSILLLINGLFLFAGSMLLWTWWRYLGEDERRAILATWRSRLSLRRSSIVRYPGRRDE